MPLKEELISSLPSPHRNSQANLATKKTSGFGLATKEMDLLSITASVAAVTQLTGQIISSCCAFVSVIRNAPQHLTAIETEVQSLEATIRVLDLTEKQPALQGSPFVTNLNAPLDACQLSLKELSELLECGAIPSGMSPENQPSPRATR